jgi:predicted phosphate transport protein (TIGR00153 family)
VIFSPKKDIFLDTLSEIAENVKAAAQYFVDYKIRNADSLPELAKNMKAYETKGDEYVHELIVSLNKTFITPLEREDILALAVSMDDILDHLEHCTSRFELFTITKVDDYMRQFADKILASTVEMAEAVKLLSRKKLMEVRPYVIKINDLESECDNLIRNSIRDLFLHEKDPIKIIQYKELYEKMEDISNSCEDAADVLETIIMRNA